MRPDWFKNVEDNYGNIHSEVFRGAVKKNSMCVNSALSNYHGSGRKFKFHYQSHKDPFQHAYFDDWHFSVWIRKLKSRYWFKNKAGRRESVSFEELVNDKNCKKRGLEIMYEKNTDQYFLHYPVDVNYFYEKDIRNDNQAKYVCTSNDRIISLDPGIRKFMVGYDHNGKIIFFGDKGNVEIMKTLRTIDLLNKDSIINKDEIYLLWKKVKNMVSELHWKTINYLISNYDTILLPDFRISEMVKGRTISKETKRMLYQYSFHAFKLRLMDKCARYGKKLIIVDESYTSKTCCNCGKQNNVGGSEVYSCSSCGQVIDRDINGAYNIYIKNKLYKKPTKGTRCTP
jgi:IS605 OrfB family transposase